PPLAEIVPLFRCGGGCLSAGGGAFGCPRVTAIGSGGGRGGAPSRREGWATRAPPGAGRGGGGVGAPAGAGVPAPSARGRESAPAIGPGPALARPPAPRWAGTTEEAPARRAGFPSGPQAITGK